MTERQIGLEEVSAEYAAFVNKFKSKKTTDDCYTPPNIYDVVAEWVIQEYKVARSQFVRPFYPGGDYEKVEYAPNAVVVDNPPFSIISKIASFYARNDIHFFLFAPHLTNLNVGASNKKIQHIITGTSITYENGAAVGTSFVTNMDTWYIRTAPDLARAIKKANDDNLAKIKKQVPKYSYPCEVITSASLGYLANHDIAFYVAADDVCFIHSLEAQKSMGKTLFGGGLLMSERAAAERAAAERAAAERAAAERAAAITWNLSEEEKFVVKSLGKDGIAPKWLPLFNDF